MKQQRDEGPYRPIPGFPLYEIDPFANIRRILGGKRKVLSPRILRGSCVIRLTASDGSRRDSQVHKLMQVAFMKPPGVDQVLYHKNFNKQDNWLSNLAYINVVELGRLNGPRSRSRPVAKLDPFGEILAVYSSASSAAKANYMTIYMVLSRCHKKVLRDAPDGHHYRFDDEIEYDEQTFAAPVKRGRPRKT